jgi:hypothetical protein
MVMSAVLLLSDWNGVSMKIREKVKAEEEEEKSDPQDETEQVGSTKDPATRDPEQGHLPGDGDHTHHTQDDVACCSTQSFESNESSIEAICSKVPKPKNEHVMKYNHGNVLCHQGTVHPC